MDRKIESRQIQDLATIAISLSPSEQREFVRNSVEGDASVEREVMRLVKCHLRNTKQIQKLKTMVAESSTDRLAPSTDPPPNRTYEFTGRQVGMSLGSVAAIFLATMIGWSMSMKNSNQQNEALSSTVEELSKNLAELNLANSIQPATGGRTATGVRTATRPTTPDTVWR